MKFFDFISLFIVAVFRLSGGVLSFFATLVFSKLCGASEAGSVFWALAFLMMLSCISRFGLDKVVLRFVSVSWHEGRFAEVRGGLALAMIVVLLGSLIGVFSLQYLLHTWGGRFSVGDRVVVLVGFVWAVPFMALVALIAEALQGLQRPAASAYILNVSPNLLIILGAFTVYFIDSDLSAGRVSQVVLISYFITMAHGLYMLIPVFSGRGVVLPDLKLQLKRCFPLYVGDVMGLAVLWGCPIIAGLWLSKVEIANLAFAQRLSLLVGIVLVAMNMVVGSKFAILFSAGKYNELRVLAQRASLLSTCLAAPFVFLMFSLPDGIMHWVGEDFSMTAELLRILSIGQLINAMTGSVGYLLVMCGHEKDMRNISVISGLSAICLPFILIPWLGYIGAAVAIAVSLALQNLLALLYVRIRLGFWSFGFFCGSG